MYLINKFLQSLNNYMSILNSPRNSHFKINFNSNDVHSMNRNKKFNKNNNLLKVYHQNIRGLKGKINELLFSFLTESPHII